MFLSFVLFVLYCGPLLSPLDAFLNFVRRVA